MGFKILMATSLVFFLITDNTGCGASAVLQGQLKIIEFQEGDNAPWVDSPEQYAVVGAGKKFSVNLDGSLCEGTMTHGSGNQLNISGLSCAPSCCGNTLAQSILTALGSVDQYSTEAESVIILTGSQGNVKLEMQD